MPTSYSDDNLVNAFTVNVKSPVAPAMLSAYKRIIDARLDAELSGIFDNWLSVKNGTIPEQIIMVASMLVAAMIEKAKYAVNEAGQAQPNPYGVDLEKQGLGLLMAIKNGDTAVPGLTRFTPIETEAGQGTFDPVGNLKSQGAWNPVWNPRRSY